MSKKKQAKKSTQPSQVRSAKGPSFLDHPHLSYFVTGIFLLLGAIGLYNHEMWRDEHQAWLVAREADSFAGLYANMKYEGNPMLWHSLLWILNLFTANPASMQVFHLVIAAGFIFLLNKYAPFPKWILLLLTLNYFLFYEYTVISRGYGLGVLLAFACCALFKHRNKYFLLLGGLLFLLTNTSIYGSFMATAICSLIILHYIFHRNEDEIPFPFLKMLFITLMTMVGAVLCIFQVMPEPDNSFPVIYPPEAFDYNRLWFCAWKIFTSWFSVPDLGRLDFWNSSYFVNDAMQTMALIPILIFLLFSLMLARQRAVLFVFVLGSIGMLGFFYYSLLTHGRYLGHFLILLIICLWLAEFFKPGAVSGLASIGAKVRKFIFPFAMGISAIGGVGAWFKDMSVPFSGSTEAAAFLRNEKLESWTIIGGTDFVISCLPSLLQTEHAYYPERREWGTYCIWDSKRAKTIDFNVVIQSVDSFLTLEKKPVLLILSAPPMKQTPNGQEPVKEEFIAPTIKISLLKAITKPVVKDEEFYIYRAERVEKPQP